MDMQQMLEKEGSIPMTIEEFWVLHDLTLYGHGYHVYMNIWNLLIGDDGLVCLKESGTDFDQYAVPIFKESNFVRHLLANLYFRIF